MDIQQVEKFEVLPSNQPADGVYSFSKGNPIITFNIGSVPKLLRAGSVRINGKIQVKTSAGAALDNLGLKGGSATDVKMNSRVGVNSIFQNVNIASNESNQTLESIRQYGRMIATVLPSVQSEEDFMSHSGVVSKSTAVQDCIDAQLNNKMAFSLRLFSGMFQSGSAIPLGVNGLRGLAINLELSPDSNVLFSDNVAGNSGAYYEVSDLSISGDMLIPSPAEQQKLAVPSSGQFVFNTFQNLYSVLNSSDSTQTFNLASSQVLSVFHNFLPTTHTNAFSQDGFATDMLKNIGSTSVYDADVVLKKVSFSRGGLKLKLDYDLDCQDQSTDGIPETGVQVNAINSLQPYSSLTKMLNQPQLFPYGTKDGVISSDTTPNASDGNAAYPLPRPEPQVLTAVDSKRNFSVGLALDRVSGQGIDFKGQSYALRLQSTADGNSPMAVFTYYLAKNVLSYTPQGIMVSS